MGGLTGEGEGENSELFAKPQVLANFIGSVLAFNVVGYSRPFIVSGVDPNIMTSLARSQEFAAIFLQNFL